MRFPSKADEPDEEHLPYPIETIRYWYVSPFGGRSAELTADQVGVNRAALARNTELGSKDRVSVGLSGNDPDRPLFFQKPFEVVPLDERRPLAAELSPHGEIVLSDPPYDFVIRPHLQPEIGEAVVLKGTAAKRLDDNPEWLAELLGKAVRRPDF
ncbi:MAG TPA: hypothetical protein VGR51_11165 [Thermoplasmata archaeon]|jgi:hypothetical protein|nr:hypothetical protein [Thermoplasmata archaeon]